MTQQERSGLNEDAEISAHAAGAVRGAIKTGKAVSGAAKGAAAAGPYGAAAAALWTHRKAVAAIIAGLLVLPVLFIMLLPSLIFGGLTKAGVEGSPDTPILNDNAAIVENINQISQAISDLLEEGQEDVRARIDMDFTASGADQKEIINPYESSPAYNANRFIAMYCAAKNQDYASISLKDMEDVIRKAKPEPAPTPKPAASGNIYSIAEAVRVGNEYAKAQYGVTIDTDLTAENASYFPGTADSVAWLAANGGQEALNRAVRGNVDSTFQYLAAMDSADAVRAYARFNCAVRYSAASDEYIVVVLYG